MNQRIETSRLYLRPLQIEESPFITEVMNTYPEMSQWMTWSPPQTEEQVKKSLKKQLDEGSIPYGVFLKSDDSFIGRITLRNFVWAERDAQKTSAFLSFWVSPEFGGKGYGTELLEVVCRHAFEKLHLRKIFAGVFVQNIPSQKLLEKVGFKEIGVSHKHYLKEGIEYDSARYELLVEDFFGKKVAIPSQKKKRIFHHVSDKSVTLKTKNLEFRTLQEEDSKIVFDALQEFPGFDTYVMWNMPQNKEEVVEKIIKTRDLPDLNFGVYQKDQFIGRVIIRNFRFSQESALKNSAFISFWVLPPYEKYSLELLTEICRYGFKDRKLRKIFAPIFAENVRVKNVINQLPFKPVGRLRNHYLKNEVEHDSLRYEILAEDWDNK